jgi:hypothetical protein
LASFGHLPGESGLAGLPWPEDGHDRMAPEAPFDRGEQPPALDPGRYDP